jgi:hypothetical protein
MSSEGVLTDLEGYQEEGAMTAHLKMAGSPTVIALKAKLRRMDQQDSIATWFLWRDF